MSHPGLRALLAVWLLLSVGVLALATPSLERPGLYYDEALLAGPALEFLTGQVRGPHVPGMRTVELAGRSLPIVAQAYLGALKSHALIPVFAVFGGTTRVLRTTTLVWGLLGLLAAMLLTERIAGLAVALLLGTLLASDPSFVLASRHDWGPFALGFALRCAGALALVHWWQSGRAWAAAAGGLGLGLALYHKADVAALFVACSVALLVVGPRTLVGRLRRQPGCLAWMAAGFALGSAPMLASLGDLWAAGGAIGTRATLPEKLRVLASALDGSYFDRLMRVGGRFERMFDATPHVWSPLGVVCLLALPVLAVAAPRASPGRCRTVAFVWIAVGLAALATLSLPGASRLHHALDLYPLPHLAVALAGVCVFEATGRRLLRMAAVLVLAACVLGGAVATARSLAFVRETGGRGRWSDAIFRMARELDADDGDALVSLDWGSNEPLRFLTRLPALAEPVWKLQRVVPGRTRVVLDGSGRTSYLVPDGDHRLYPYGDRFLEAVEQLEPGRVTIERYPDREGQGAWLAVRLGAPHRLVYSGFFRVEWR